MQKISLLDVEMRLERSFPFDIFQGSANEKNEVKIYRLVPPQRRVNTKRHVQNVGRGEIFLQI
jgi:hypothetical protein